MEYAVRKLDNEFSKPSHVYRVCFRHSPEDRWIKVLGTDDYTTERAALAVLAEILGG